MFRCSEKFPTSILAASAHPIKSLMACQSSRNSKAKTNLASLERANKAQQLLKSLSKSLVASPKDPHQIVCRICQANKSEINQKKVSNHSPQIHLELALPVLGKKAQKWFGLHCALFWDIPRNKHSRNTKQTHPSIERGENNVTSNNQIKLPKVLQDGLKETSPNFTKDWKSLF